MTMAKAEFEAPTREDVGAGASRAGEQMYERVVKRLREELSEEGAERRRLQAQLNEVRGRAGAE